MSYDIYLCDPHSDRTLHLDQPHMFQGGTCIVNGTDECWLNVTYNYSKHFYDLFPADGDERGIRWLYGRTAAETIPTLESIIEKLRPDEGGYSYWDATEGNARRALEGLLFFAKARPDGVWRGD